MTEMTSTQDADVSRLLDVEFLDLNTNEVARFAVPGHVTLAEAWNMAYAELDETKRESDILESRSGQPLTADLDKTVKYVREHVVHDLRFQIHGEQGGA